jgi:hypothetical protein
MIKTGKALRFICILFVVFIVSDYSNAQNISVDASLSETNIFSGESVRLDITISGQALNSIDRPQITNVEGLRWLQGSTSQSTNYSYVNGRPNIAYTFGYSFIAETPGNYNFPSLTLDVNGTKYSTKPISFKILDPNTINKSNNTRSPDIYVRLEPSTDTPIVGEQVIASIVLYFKNDVEVASYQPSPGWKAEGFWKEDLENRQQARTTSTLIGGVRYQRAVLLQTAIFPTKSGKLELSPYEVTVQVRNRNRRRDIFSFGMGQERKELQTLPVSIDVRPLPNVDAVYSGAVGKFQISRTINPENAFVGESIEITTTITGQGNIPLIVKPEYKYPESLELYDPQESSSITRSGQQIGGSKTFTDIVIARNEGEYEIPSEQFAYYDPDLRRYSTVPLPKLTFFAERDPRLAVSTGNEYQFDIKPITGLTNWSTLNTDALTQKSWVWIILCIQMLSLGIAFIFKKYKDRMNTDSAFARSQKAKDLAMEELELAENSTDIKNGYHSIERALFQFVADKLDLPKAGLSSAELALHLNNKTDEETSKELKKILDKCETISYAPNTTPQGLHNDVDRSKELIKKIGKLL